MPVHGNPGLRLVGVRSWDLADGTTVVLGPLQSSIPPVAYVLLRQNRKFPFRCEERHAEEKYDQAAADRFVAENSDSVRFGGMAGRTGNKLEAPRLMWN